MNLESRAEEQFGSSCVSSPPLSAALRVFVFESPAGERISEQTNERRWLASIEMIEEFTEGKLYLHLKDASAYVTAMRS